MALRRARFRNLLLATAALLIGPCGVAAAAPAISFADAVKDLQPLKGLLPVYLDRRGGRVLLALTPDKDGDCGQFIYQVDIRSGLGSTPVGIDRAAPGRSQIVDFHRHGRRIMADAAARAGVAIDTTAVPSFTYSSAQTTRSLTKLGSNVLILTGSSSYSGRRQRSGCS